MGPPATGCHQKGKCWTRAPAYMDPSVPWQMATSGTWAAGCAAALGVLYLWRPAAASSTFCRARFGGYCGCHVVAALCQAYRAATCSAEGCDKGGTRHSGLNFFGRFFVLTAAGCMALLGAELIKPYDVVLRRRAGKAMVAHLVICAAALAALIFADAGQYKSATNAFGIGVYSLACAIGFCGVLCAQRRHPAAWQIRLLLLSSICGLVDALLPLLAPRGAPWQPSFAARLLDVILWLPGAVIGFRWLDGAAVRAGHDTHAGRTTRSTSGATARLTPRASEESVRTRRPRREKSPPRTRASPVRSGYHHGAVSVRVPRR